MMHQLSHFELPAQEETEQDESPPQALADIRWSYSRRSTLEKCVRCYYYEYYGASKRTAKRDADKDILHFLKQLPTRHEQAGKALHSAIRAYLRKKQEGKFWQTDLFVTWGREIFRQHVTFSMSHPDGDVVPTGTFPPVLLSEFYYREPNALDLCEEVGEKLAHALTVFASDPRFDPFRTWGSQQGALTEHPLKLSDSFPCRIDGRVDLAYSTAERVTIVDWKLGSEDGMGDDSLQLAVYALWAVEHFRTVPESLRICKAHLGSASIVDFEANQSLLAAARARIVQDAERMLMLDQYGQEAVVEAFTPCLQPNICKLCSYRKVCPEAQEVLHA